MVRQQEITAFLGLGGNLGKPDDAFRRTRQKFADHPLVTDCQSASLYRTPPIGGPAGQPDYINTALMLKTSLGPQELLAVCQSLELAEGRQRHEHWGPRTLDIDLLLYGREQICKFDLEVPHPRLAERHFVLLPLVELAPNVIHPVRGLSLQDLLTLLPPAEKIRILNRNW